MKLKSVATNSLAIAARTRWSTANIDRTIREWLKPEKKKKIQFKTKANARQKEKENEAKCMQRKLNMTKNHRQNCTQLNKGDITCSDSSSSNNKTYKMYATSSGCNSCWWRRFISIAVLVQILANCGKFNCVFPFFSLSLSRVSSIFVISLLVVRLLRDIAVSQSPTNIK